MPTRQRPGHERRLWMRLRSRYDLIALMIQRGISVRELAHWAHCHPSMIGHLRSGHLSTCTPMLAARIEKALAVEPGRLFDPKVVSSMPGASSVASDTGRRSA